MVLYKTKSRGGFFVVCIVPMCCLSSTSNKEHTFKVMGGMCWYWGILFDEGWSFIRRGPLNVVVASKILYGSRVGNVPCSSDIGCIQK